ncbi:MAG TPA: L-threonine 3-dehydrogenase [Elusimicrobiota bacterium]|jgi:threonine 3-dehydrogenase|nr:L-threonine 3-dehydrogenase [Elusimicrobiota bacterium]
MRALLKSKAGPGAALADLAAPRIGKDDLLVKVRRASICGSDMPIYNWYSWAPRRFPLPMVFGHEFCGEVAEVGAAAKGFRKGDFVSIESHVYCGKCPQCRSGQQHVCRELKIMGIDLPGGFAEYARVPARCAWKHRTKGLEDVGSLLEPMGNAVYAALVEKIAGKSVLVLGCGPQGLFAVAAAKSGKARPVIAVDGSAFRRRLATRMGADLTLDPAAPDYAARVRKAAGDPGGVDVVLEMSGAPAAIEAGLKAVKSGGRVTAFGIPPGPLSIDWANDIVFKGIRVFGIAGRQIFGTWKTMDRLLKAKAIDPRPVVTHRFPISRFQDAFAVMNSPKKDCGKVVLEIS